MYSTQKMFDRLADLFKKSEESNVGKIIKIFSEQLQMLEDTNRKIKDWRSIDQAKGKGLDLIGENILQSRGSATDEIYQVLLKSKLARSLSTGDINTIIQVLSVALNTEKEEVRIKEKWSDPDYPEEAAISVIEVPIKRLNEVGLAPDQFGVIVQKTVASGVRVESVQLQGTFAFGSIPKEQDSESGFSDVERTTGGSLGAVFRPSGDRELPL